MYVDTLRKELSGKIKSLIITTGQGPVTDFSLCNLKQFHPVLYLFEVPLNVMLLSCLILFGRINRQVLFHIHGAANLAPIIVAFLFRIPVVWHFHETVDAFRGLVKTGQWFVRRTNHRLLSVSRRSAEVYGLNDYQLAPAGVDVDFWSRDQLRFMDSDADAVLKILSVGNLNPLKGHDVLLQALINLDRPYQLKIIGDRLETHPAYFEKLDGLVKLINHSCSGCSVELMGWQDREAVRESMVRADLFILPSRSEACPIALLEAMSMQVPCIATDVGDVSAMLSSDAGIVVPSGSPDALLRAIRGVVEMPDDWRLKMMESARKKVISSLYDSRVMADRIIDAYVALQCKRDKDSTSD